MKLLKQAMAVLGTILTIVLILAIVSPKTAHAIAATLVQIEPNGTTHVLQNETQLVNLYCLYTYSPAGCAELDASGNLASAAYVVPAGYTLVVTDWSFQCITSGCKNFVDEGVGYDGLSASGSGFWSAQGFATPNASGGYHGNVKFTTGVRFASGTTVQDIVDNYGYGNAAVQGYLVPN